MNYHDDWPDNTAEIRRAMIRETIRPATVEELVEFGENRFPVATDPWCERYNEFLRQHPSAKFYRAEIPNGVEIVYCRDTDQGLWFLPGIGMGIIQPKGLGVLAEMVNAL